MARPSVLYEVKEGVGTITLSRPRVVNALDTARMQPYFADAHVLPLALGETLPFQLPAANGQTAQFTVAAFGFGASVWDGAVTDCAADSFPAPPRF